MVLHSWHSQSIFRLLSTFNVDLNNVRQQGCHFQRRFSQRWATLKQRCEYDHIKKKLSLDSIFNFKRQVQVHHDYTVLILYVSFKS